jgi:hypothetical protein
MTTPDEERVMINELLKILRVSEEWMAAKPTTVENGSSFSGDDAKTEPFQLSHGVAQSITNAVDHLHCFRMALTGTGDSVLRLHTYAPFTLLRGAIENAAIAVWVMSSNNRKERVTRHLWHELTSVRRLQSLLEAAGEPVGQVTLGRKNALLDLAAACGIDRRAVDNRDLTASIIVKSASDAAGLTDGQLPLAFLFWKMCSAIAHGDRGYVGLFEHERVGPISPGVSSVIVTAKTQQLVSGSRGAVAMITAARALAAQRSASHLTQTQLAA